MNTLDSNRVLMRRILLALSISWVISSSGLIVSYNLPKSTVLWREAFGENGWVIEFIRGFIIALGTAVILIQVFPDETNEFIQFRNHKSVSLKLIRTAALVVAIAGTCYILWHHFYDGPEYLANPLKPSSQPPEWYKLTQPRIYPSQPGYFEKYQLPYLCYLPYSFVNFICFAIPAFAVILYASVKNLVAVDQSKRNLLTLGFNVSLNRDTKEVERQFELFCINLIDIIGRYSVLFLIMSVLVTFEHRIGYKTLSIYGRFWAWIGYMLICSALLAIFVGFSYYGEAFQQCARKIVEMGGDVREFENKHSVPRILNRILMRHLTLYVTLAILLATFPVISKIGRMLGLSI